MILFPNAKINLGLRVLRRRPDGYHDLATVMMPVGWTDILEIVPSRTGKTTLEVSGRVVACPPEKNLVMKAYRALSDEVGTLPAAEMYLEKVIPDGAGMGGGSADAAFAIKGLNEVFSLGLDDSDMARVAGRVGADCPFFIYNRPLLCTGTGTTIERGISLDLSQYWLAIAKPRVASVSTAEAYAGVTPCEAAVSPADILCRDITQWDGALTNDFEPSILSRLPQVGAIKEAFTQSGALYTSMTGSGSAVFALFASDKLAHKAVSELSECDTFVERGRAW